MANAHNLIANLKLNSGTFDKNLKKSRQGMTRFGKDMQRVSKQLLAFGGGYLLVNRAVKGAVRAFIEQENAERSLIAATGKSITSLKKFAAEIQRVTVFGDEQILSQMAYARNLGVTTEQLEDATTAAVGLAAKFRLDLATSMMLVGRASQGQTQMLTRYGIVLKESLSVQEKFNALLKIGADAFHLAEADTKTLQGAWRQFANNAGDFAETIVGAWLDVGKGLADVAKHYAGVEKSAESAEDVMKRIKTVMPSFQTNMPGAFFYPVPTKRSEQVGPRAEEKLAEANRKARSDMITLGIKKHAANIKLQNEQRAKASEINKRFLDTINKEIELTGKVGDARQHAAKMIDMQNKLKEAGLEGTIAATEETNKLKEALDRLGEAQKLQKIAEDIGSAFADAFTDMIFEAKRFGDVMKSLMKDIARSVVKNLITTRLAQGISAGIGGIFGLTPATVQHSGGVVGRGGPTRNVSPGVFASAPRLHNGLAGDEFPAILQRGETVTPRGGGGGNAPTIIINNNTGQKMRQDGPAQFNGREMVIKIVADDIENGGQLRTLVERV